MNHYTLSKSCNISGIGIHSGNPVTLTFKPSSSGTICFYHTPSGKSIQVGPDQAAENHLRSTQLSSNGIIINTPEHLLAACAALGLTSLDIDINHSEVPILDGSSAPFIELFEDIGLTRLSQLKTIQPITINSPITIKSKDACIIAMPATKSFFSYYLSYDHPVVGSQTQSIEFSLNAFKQHIASARTYGFEDEVKVLKHQGLALGGSLDNALVIGNKAYVNTPRFENECARHKLLDLVGDCWILNRPIVGHVIGIKSGHQLNIEFVNYLHKKY